jgi:hypothetical protein
VSTYRVGNNWGVTIVREGHGEPNASNCGRVDDQLVAVIVNGDQALAERICALLNGEVGDPGLCAAERRGAGNVCEAHGCVYPGDNPGISCRSQP